MHSSKRQLLHVLYLCHVYQRIKNGKGTPGGIRRLHLFSGKASPSDYLAKQVINLISIVADRVNQDPQTNGLMQVLMIPDFSLSWAEVIVPAIDLFEQLSTAGQEPSGMFAMKGAMNGAITITSLSGAAVEFVEKIGRENVFTFGKTGSDLAGLGNYRPIDILAGDERLKAIFAFLENDLIPSTSNGHVMYPLLSSLRDADRQFVLLDFGDYCAKQEKVEKLYADQNAWQRMGLMNIARSGWFSSDRAINEYTRTIWNVSNE
jgi:starch phosphorylase